MRYYGNIYDMYFEVKRDLKEMGIEYVSATVQDQKVEKKTKELYNYCYTLDGFNAQEKLIDEIGINKEWLEAEIKDRTNISLKFKNPGIGWQHNAGFWAQFMREGMFAYTYAERLHPQIRSVYQELVLRPNTRQAILTMYDQHQDLMNLGGRDRVPCSMHYQFLRREGMLHMNYVMRSCDFIKFFIPDVIMARSIQLWLCDMLGIPAGSFVHFIGSLHAFEEDLEGVF